jgi:hypothetical protein
MVQEFDVNLDGLLDREEFAEFIRKLTADSLFTFQRDLAYALYANAIAQDDDRMGRSQRDASLAEAAELLSSLPAEAQQLWDMHAVADLVAAARRS